MLQFSSRKSIKEGNMLIKSFLALAIFALSFNALGVIALAQTGGNTNTTTQTTTQQTIQQRITERKTALKTTLDTATQTKIKAKCVAAQKLVTNAKTKSDKAIQNRQKAYDAISTRMTALVDALDKNGIDTTTIEDLQAQVKTALDTFKKDVEAYSQTLSDLSSMDCTADPTGFKATLDTARTQRKQVAKDAAALRTLTGKITAELAKIKGQNASISNPKTTGGGTQ